MPKFRVIVMETRRHVCVVEADDAEEARELIEEDHNEYSQTDEFQEAVLDGEPEEIDEDAAARI